MEHTTAFPPALAAADTALVARILRTIRACGDANTQPVTLTLCPEECRALIRAFDAPRAWFVGPIVPVSGAALAYRQGPSGRTKGDVRP